MNSHKNSNKKPTFEVIRRPTPGAPVVPTPTPAPSTSIAPTPTRIAPRPTYDRMATSSSLTPERIQALARRERVPNRIARGELEGKMKCRIWRKLHPEEARRFDLAYQLLQANPALSLPDAFAILQSGMTVPEYLERRSRQVRREDVKQSRTALSNAAVEQLWNRWLTSHEELSVVMADKTFCDSVMGSFPLDLEFRRSGIFPKLNIVLVAPRAYWESLVSSLPRQTKLARKPAPVSRQPTRRPVADGRVFLTHLQSKIQVVLRNGVTLEQPLLAVGPFDLILGAPTREFWVPLHAIVKWSAVKPTV